MLRPITDHDLAAVHAINQAAVPAVGELTAEQLADLVAMAAMALVAVTGDVIVGFALILGPSCDYASPNYAYFRGRHPDFTYVDRIAVAPDGQGQGIGRAIYERVIATSTAPVLCAEVNVRPRNDASLAFHARLGFEALGEQETYGGSARVRMLERKLEPNPS